MNMMNMNPQAMLNMMIQQNPAMKQAYNQMLELQKQTGGDVSKVNIQGMLKGKTFSQEEINKFKNAANALGVPEEEVNNVLSMVNK